jgi:hypothetical protein
MKYLEEKEEIFTSNHQISRNSYCLNSNNFSAKVRQIILLYFSQYLTELFLIPNLPYLS